MSCADAQVAVIGGGVVGCAVAHALARRQQVPRAATLESKLERVLRFLADSFRDARLVDPANPDNVVTDDLRESDKALVTSAAQAACRAPGWEWIVW